MCMDHFGGVNFTVGSRGGYRNQADCLVKIEAKNLVLAISRGWEFFENKVHQPCFWCRKMDQR